MTAAPATAQNIASASCASFKDADKDPAQQAVFLAYLQGYANASSPDPRYIQSDAALADDAKKIRDWCGKNPKSTYAEAVAAVLPSPAQAAPAATGPVYALIGCRP
jgi:HdeA/HdeB family